MHTAQPVRSQQRSTVRVAAAVSHSPSRPFCCTHRVGHARPLLPAAAQRGDAECELRHARVLVRHSAEDGCRPRRARGAQQPVEAPQRERAPKEVPRGLGVQQYRRRQPEEADVVQQPAKNSIAAVLRAECATQTAARMWRRTGTAGTSAAARPPASPDRAARRRCIPPAGPSPSQSCPHAATLPPSACPPHPARGRRSSPPDSTAGMPAGRGGRLPSVATAVASEPC